MLLDRETAAGNYYSPMDCGAGIVKAMLQHPEGKALGPGKLKKARTRLMTKGAIKTVPHPGKAPSRANPVVVRNKAYGRLADDENSEE
jgi:hypothetical protein